MYSSYDLSTLDLIGLEKAKKGEPSLKTQEKSPSLNEAGETDVTNIDGTTIDRATKEVLEAGGAVARAGEEDQERKNKEEKIA